MVLWRRERAIAKAFGLDAATQALASYCSILNWGPYESWSNRNEVFGLHAS
jgi:hypothetical protein